MNYASRTTRLVGQILDAVIGYAPVILLTIADRFDGSVLVYVGLIWCLFYYLFADGLAGGQSYGKRIVGIRVVDETSRSPCGFGQSFLRNFLLYLLGPIDWIFIFGNKHQRLGDKLAGTVVVTA